MKGILIISHGKLAEGMKDTLELFSGEIEQLDTLELEASQEMQEFSFLLRNKIDELDTGDGVVVFTDLAFGTPSNVTASLLGIESYKDKIQMITGMNLPMILEYTQMREANVNYTDIVQVGKDGIIDFNQRLKKD